MPLTTQTNDPSSVGTIPDNANISGSATANLNINSVSLTDAGAYICIVSGESSAPAILTI
ncbi:unnamed protein product, partial [marine sediment metagenome]